MDPNRPATIDDLLGVPEDGHKHELVDGEILVTPAGMRHSEIAARIRVLLARGVPIVWRVDPRSETVTLYRSPNATATMTAKDTLTAEPVLPGFSNRVADSF